MALLTRDRTETSAPHEAAAAAVPSGGGRLPVHRRLVHVLHAAVGTIGRSDSQKNLLDDVLQAILGMSGVDHGFLACLHADGNELVVRVAAGLFADTEGRGFERGTGLVGQVWKDRQTVSIDDYGSWTGRGIDLSAHGATTVAAVPVVADGTVIAVLVVAHDAPGSPFDAPDLDALEAAARVVALVLARDTEMLALHETRRVAETTEGIEQRLRAEEQRILDLVPVGIWVKDRENRVRRANEAAARSLSLPRSTIEDRYLWEIDPRHAASSYRRDLEVFEDGEAHHGELEERVDKSGERRWWRVDRTVLRDDEGRAEGIVVVTRDVTDEHVAQGHLEASRRAEIRARRIRAHAVASIAQNVRGPLRRVRDGLSSDPQHAELLQDLESAAQWIDDLIDFERVETGNLPIECTPVDVGDVAEDVVDLVARSAFAQGNELAVHVDATIPSVLGGDPIRVRQILVQILAQANRATRDGEILLSARSVMNGPARCEVRFEVHVSAWALSDREVETRFGPYLHGDEAVGADEVQPGAMGLALAHRLVEVLGGAVGAEMQADGSASLWCTLPFDRVAAGDTGPLPTVSCAGARVLLAIDRPTVAVVLERQLRDLGVAVDRAHDLDEARTMIDAAREDEWRHDAILVDSTSDLEAVGRWATALDPEARGRVTALVPFGAAHEGATFGGDRPTLTKPVRRRRLLDVVLRRVGAAPGPAEPTPSLADDDTPRRVLLVHDESADRRLVAGTLREIGCEVVEADTPSLAGEPLAGSFDLVISFDGAEKRGSSPVVEAVRRHDGSRDHTPVLLLAPRLGAVEHDVGLAAGADAVLAPPASPDRWEALVRRWARVPGARS